MTTQSKLEAAARAVVEAWDQWKAFDKQEEGINALRAALEESAQQTPTYPEAMVKLQGAMCGKCQGYGVVDDADLGDISYNQYVCPECKGSGFWKESAQEQGEVTTTALRVAPVLAVDQQPVAWQWRQWDNCIWGDWRTVGYKPQGPQDVRFQMRPIYTHPTITEASAEDALNTIDNLCKWKNGVVSYLDIWRACETWMKEQGK